MKEFSIEQKAKAYDEAIERAKNTIEVNQTIPDIVECVESLFPELKASDGERIRKAIGYAIGQSNHSDGTLINGVSSEEALAWLEKQGEKPQGKSALEAINEEKVDNANKVEPKFKVKYAGNEYNVLDVKHTSGVTYYGIEDEPHHIDYVYANNCKIISGYAIKENGSSNPTKSAMFSAWSEEDENVINHLLAICAGAKRYRQFAGCLQEDITKYQTWLKSLRPQIQWRPSDEQMDALRYVANFDYGGHKATLVSLYEQLKKLREK